MIQATCELPEPVGTPREWPTVTLLVELPSRRSEFLSNLLAALGPRGEPLPFEHLAGGDPVREIGVSTLLHIFVCAALLVLLPKLRPPVAVVLTSRPQNYEIVYYPARSLPQMEDGGGAAEGRRGAAGGREAFHPTQTIRIARAPVARRVIVEAPRLSLPVVAGPAANLLSLPSLPAPRPPALPPQPVRVETKTGKIHLHLPSAVEAPAPQLSAGTLPQVPLAPVSAVPRPALERVITLPPAPAPAAPQIRIKAKTVELASVPQPQLPLVPVVPVNEPAEAGSAASIASPTIVISVSPGDAVGAPAEGGPGSLAMSPKGRAESGLGGDGGGGGVGRGTGPGSATAGTGPGAGRTGSGPGSTPSAGPGTSAANGPGGSGNGSPGGIPGVTIRGGAVWLDSFGPKVAPSAPNGKRVANPADAPRKSAAITVIATPRSGGGLNAYGVFKGQQVYTIYVDTRAGAVVVQFAARQAAASYNGELTAPDPVKTDLPALPAASGAVIACVLDASGRVQNARMIQGNARLHRAILEAVREWRFHPALKRGEPVEVDALIGIGTGVR
jgi:endoglucanase